jgi:hypothetical protein
MTSELPRLPSGALLDGTAEVAAGAVPYEAEVLDACGLGRQRNPTESIMKWTPLKVEFKLPHGSAEIKREASVCGTNSKDPQRTESFGSDGVDDSSTNAADVTGTADDLPCADRLPIDGANCRGYSSTMPSVWGLG